VKFVKVYPAATGHPMFINIDHIVCFTQDPDVDRRFHEDRTNVWVTDERDEPLSVLGNARELAASILRQGMGPV
jgi:hypothetical protein